MRLVTPEGRTTCWGALVMGALRYKDFIVLWQSGRTDTETWRLYRRPSGNRCHGTRKWERRYGR